GTSLATLCVCSCSLLNAGLKSANLRGQRSTLAVNSSRYRQGEVKTHPGMNCPYQDKAWPLSNASVSPRTLYVVEKDFRIGQWPRLRLISALGLRLGDFTISGAQQRLSWQSLACSLTSSRRCSIT